MKIDPYCQQQCLEAVYVCIYCIKELQKLINTTSTDVVVELNPSVDRCQSSTHVLLVAKTAVTVVSVGIELILSCK